MPLVCGFYTVEGLLAECDEAGIEPAVVLPIVNPEVYIPQAHEDILDMAAQYFNDLRCEEIAPGR